jgi:tetratricopeptide (TPR) repeat protein
MQDAPLNAAKAQQLLAQIRTAAQQLRNGRRADALLTYDEVSQQSGDNVAVNVELGHLCNELGAVDEAIAHYTVAAEAEPENAYFLSYLGVVLEKNGQSEKALQIFNRALAIDDGITEVLHGLGLCYKARADNVQARAYLQRAHETKPGDAAVRVNLAATLADLNEHELALKHAEKGLKLDPSNPVAHYTVGRILAEMGRTDDAIRQFEKTIRQHKSFGGAYDFLARMKKFSPADKAFIDKTEQVLRIGMPAEQRCSVHYALGKMYDDCREWDKAFEHFRQANLLQKRDYDAKFERRQFRQVKKVFNSAALEEYRALGHPSAQPVFIVGMPRSGTTLMERMIASHPQAAGASELPEIPRIAGLVAPADDLRHYAAQARKNLTSDNIRQYAEDYLGVLRQGRAGAQRVVDKLPGNFLHLGLIDTLFPNATIIHAIRHPLDICLSCYFQNFTNLRWANDLELIGEMYRLYRDVMAYWQTILPQGRIVDVEYEKLIADPEVQGRRMVEACGLTWDDSSIEFHRADGVVRTASLWQVRQPIYKSSNRRWMNYASHVGVLANGLADFLQNDRQELSDRGVNIAAPSGIKLLKGLFR